MVDFAKLNEESKQRRARLEGLSPEEQAAFHAKEKQEKAATQAREDANHNERVKADNRKEVVSGYIVGPVQSRYMPQWEDSMRSGEPFLDISLRVTTRPPTGNPEADYMTSKKVHLIVPQGKEGEPSIIHTLFPHNTYNQDTGAEVSLDTRSPHIHHFAGKWSGKLQSIKAYEHAEGENPWPNLNTTQRLGDAQTSPASPPRTAPTASTTASVLIVMAPTPAEYPKIMDKIKDSMATTPYPQVRVFGAQEKDCEQLSTQIQVAYPRTKVGTMTAQGLRAAPNEKKALIQAYIRDKATVLDAHDTPADVAKQALLTQVSTHKSQEPTTSARNTAR